VRKINNLDIGLIRTFVTIVNNQGYARASQILNLTESAVSHQMKRLEDQIGALLFQRKGRIKELTEVGEIFLGYANQILAMNDELYERISLLAKESEIIHFGLPEYFADRILHKLLLEFSNTFPTIDFRTQVKSNFALSQDIKLERLDFAIVIGNNDAPYKQMLSKEQLLWAGGQVNTRINSEQTIPLIAFEAPCPFRNAMIEALNKQNIIWQIAYTARNLSDLKAALKANLGISALPFMDDDTPRLIKEEYHLPSLPELEVQLLFSQQKPGQEVKQLAEIVSSLW